MAIRPAPKKVTKYIEKGTKVHEELQAYFVKYNRQCVPLDPILPGVSKRPKVKEVQSLFRVARTYVDRAERAEAQVKELERMLIDALATENRGGVALRYVEYLRNQQPPLVGQWVGTKWVDTNFVPSTGPMTVDQTNVTLDQWGDHIALTDANVKLRKTKSKLIKKLGKLVKAKKGGKR